MHQSSFRILRWTDDDRPYTKDFQDLFCTLMVALPLSQHIQFFQKFSHSFTTREALGHLGNLRFTQSNRRPSPDDPNIMVTTKIATTFSMVEPMARTLCTKFRNARFIEQVGTNLSKDESFQSPSSIWQMTPKGVKLLENFAHRNGVQDKHVHAVLDSPRNSMNLLVLEREPESDALNHDRGTVEVIFRRFAGLEGPNTGTASSVHSDSDSVDESSTGLSGVKLSLRKLPAGSRTALNVFSGKQAADWLMNCCTLVDIREASEISRLFIHYGLIALAYDEKANSSSPNPQQPFVDTKTAWYKFTQEGQRIARWVSATGISNGDAKSNSQVRDSNANRMMTIVHTPSLRLLFREFLRDTHCEENLVFWLEVRDFLGRYKAPLNKYKVNGLPPPSETLSETLAGAYDLYNAFLAPGSPCELNIDHGLRNSLVSRMTRFELPEHELQRTVDELISLYDVAQQSVFKLMASDSVPKFLRDPKYAPAIKEYNVESGSPSAGNSRLPLQSQSRNIAAVS